MTGDKFLLFIEHFLKLIMVTKPIPILLLLDKHQSHLSVRVLDLAKENEMVLLSYPSNSTHNLKLLYRTIY
jgi:hypothetical protein